MNAQNGAATMERRVGADPGDSLSPGVRSVSLRIISGLERGGEGSILVVCDNDRKVVLDCGASPGNFDEQGELTSQALKHLCGQYYPDEVVITHYHFDHFGSLADFLLGCVYVEKPWPKIICTETTAKLLGSSMMAKGLMDRSGPKYPGYEPQYQQSGRGVTLYPSKHSVPGSASVLVETSGGSILYTSDFCGVSYPARLCPDLMVVDCTNAENTSPKDMSEEDEIRENLGQIITNVYASGNPDARVFIALFSTQIERAIWLYEKTASVTGCYPSVMGPSLFHNLRVSMDDFWSSRDQFRVALLTGVWAQGSNFRDAQTLDGAKPSAMPSALVRLAEGSGQNCSIHPGDVVVLSGRVPRWLPDIMRSMHEMIGKLTSLGAKVIIDHNAPPNWAPQATRCHVHAGGHGNLPDIMAAIERAAPKKVLPFHADLTAREIVAELCRRRGIEIVEAKNGSAIQL